MFSFIFFLGLAQPFQKVDLAPQRQSLWTFSKVDKGGK
jgi:hypothetical protein